MVTYVPDTNTWVQLLRGDRKTAEKFESIDFDQIGLSCVVVEELLVGAYRSHKKQAIRAVESLTEIYSLLPFDFPCADTSAKIQADLIKTGNKIGSRDAQIAGTAIQWDAVLVTHDKAFGRIPGIKIEDWR